MQERIGVARPEEVLIFARWAADHAHGPADMALHFMPLWMRALNASERQDLHDMAARIAAVDGEPTPLQKGCLNTLRAKLGLTRG